MIKLLGVFVIIVIVLKLGKTLPAAIAAGALGTVLLFRLGAFQVLSLAFGSIISKLTITTLLAFYSITYLQRMLEKRGRLNMAQIALNAMFHNNRVNASLAPILIGMLPSAGAVTICGAIVDAAAGDSLNAEEKTFVTSYFRHIPESILPTYPSIIIGVQLSGVVMSSYLLGTFPMVLVLMGLGYFFYLRKIPISTGERTVSSVWGDILDLLRSVWSILLTIFIVIAFNIPVYIAVAAVIVMNIFIDHFSFVELREMFFRAFEAKLLFTTVVIMIFKDILSSTGAINVLPGVFEQLPIPMYLVYFLLFFIGTLLAGQQAINVIGLPLAFATIPDAGMPLLVLLMTCGYVAMQISPTHICLAIVTEYFKTSLSSLVKKTLVVIIPFCFILLGYYLLLDAIF